MSSLFELFTADRRALTGYSYLDDPKLRNAYLQYHFPLNVARATCAFEMVRAAFPEIDDFEDVVDLGAGPGTATLVSLLRLPRRERRFILTDRSRAALGVARRLVNRVATSLSLNLGDDASLGRGARVRFEQERLPLLPRLRRPALVWLNMVLNELPQKTKNEPELLELLGRKLPPGSLLVIVEPALRATGRDLLQVHDRAVESRAWRVVAPCTHQKSCPLLRAKDRSWCHFHFQWRSPEIVRRVAEPLKLDHRTPSLTLLALELGGAPPSRSDALARAIGDPMEVAAGRPRHARSGAATGIYVCRDGKRDLIRPGPEKLWRGAVVRIDATGRAERVRGW